MEPWMAQVTRQHGVISTAELRRFGLTEKANNKGRRLLSLKVAVADVGKCVVQEHMFGTGRWGCDCTRPEDRSNPPGSSRGAGGESYTYPPGTADRNRWPVRHRGGRMRRRTLTGDRTTSGFQVRRTVRRAGECLSQVHLH